MKVKKRHLFLMAAMVFGVPGVIITTKGIVGYLQLSSIEWWLFAATLFVFVVFYGIFRRVVAMYSAHIMSTPESCFLWNTFPPQGWLLIAFMMGLGIILHFVEYIPVEFVASFYSGLGPMLMWSALKFLRQMWFVETKYVDK